MIIIVIVATTATATITLSTVMIMMLLMALVVMVVLLVMWMVLIAGRINWGNSCHLSLNARLCKLLHSNLSGLRSYELNKAITL